MGLNAALNRMLYFPPALPSGDAMLHLTVERVIDRDIATPEELFLGEDVMALEVSSGAFRAQPIAVEHVSREMS